MNRLPLNRRHAPMVAMALLMALPVATRGTSLHLPQPWRQEAVVQGRDETYNAERFLHELTFRHPDVLPGPSDNGIRGTGGSVSSRRLYLDFRFRQDFGFNDERQGFLLDIQRSEDLDGAYQRQLVGFRHNLTGQTELWLQGDVFSDKSQSDLYFSARHNLGPNHWVHGSWILPDAYFNNKTDTDDEFEHKPQSFFLQWHRGLAPGQSTLGTTASITVSPSSELISRTEGLGVENESIKAAITHGERFGPWLWRVTISGEQTRRDYRLAGPDLPGQVGFDRDHVLVDTRMTNTNASFQPSLGASFLKLDETGFFGRALNDVGSVRRREPTLYADVTVPLSARTTLSPGIYLSQPDIDEVYLRNRDRKEDSFTGKLTLPLKAVLSQKDGAVLTLNPTFYLHRFGFGGGNLQLHWPM